MSGARWIVGSLVLGIAAPIAVMLFDSYDQYHAALVATEQRGPTPQTASKTERERAVFDLLNGRRDASRLVDDGPGIAFIRHTSLPTARDTSASKSPLAPALSASASPAAPHVSSSTQSVKAAPPKPARYVLAIEVDRIVGDSTVVGPIVQSFAAHVSKDCRIERELDGDRLALRLQITGDEQRATVALASMGEGPEVDDVNAAECVERVANETTWPSVSGRTLVIARVRYIAALTSAADVFLKAP